MEEALYETTILLQFSGLILEPIPDETTISTSVTCWKKHESTSKVFSVINVHLGGSSLSRRQVASVDATLIHVTSSSKSKDGKYDKEMHQTKEVSSIISASKPHR